MSYVDMSPNDTAESTREAWREVDRADDDRPSVSDERDDR